MPRPVEVRNVIYQFVIVTLREKVASKQLLIYLGFLASSLDHSKIKNQIKQVLNKLRINSKEVVGISVDVCGTNTTAHSLVEASKELQWLLLRCLSHGTSNAGKEAGFLTLSKFWGLLQNISPHSDQEKLVFFSIAQS